MNDTKTIIISLHLLQDSDIMVAISAQLSASHECQNSSRI
jgi:hypothetical protein